MSETRECVVRVCDAQGVEHRVKIRAESVYEAALLGLERLQQADWSCSDVLENDGLVTVEVWEEPTIHCLQVKKLKQWLNEPGRMPPDEAKKKKLRDLLK
jgi:hypothetical protein